jgi:hypothetical protein
MEPQGFRQKSSLLDTSPVSKPSSYDLVECELQFHAYHSACSTIVCPLSVTEPYLQPETRIPLDMGRRFHITDPDFVRMCMDSTFAFHVFDIRCLFQRQ